MESPCRRYPRHVRLSFVLALLASATLISCAEDNANDTPPDESTPCGTLCDDRLRPAETPVSSTDPSVDDPLPPVTDPVDPSPEPVEEPGIDPVEVPTPESILGLDRRCGTSDDCAAGTLCQDGLCELDCGGKDLCGHGENGFCCGLGEVCHLGECAPAGTICDLGTQTTCGSTLGLCESGQACDAALGRCVDSFGDSQCRVGIEPTFEPELLWSWTGSAAHPEFGHVLASPSVADINGDGVADIVVPVVDHVEGFPLWGGILCALSGAGTCLGGSQELWCTAPDELRVNPVSQVAIADLDGDGNLTIVTGDATRSYEGLTVVGITGYNTDGARIPDFGTDRDGNPVYVHLYAGGPSIADLDGDGFAEVIAGYAVFDHNGRLRWQRDDELGNAGFGALTLAVDLDGAPGLEIVGGNAAYHADGRSFWGPGTEAVSEPDGWPAVADFNGDGFPEVAVVSSGYLRIYDRFGMRYSTNDVLLDGNGGPPTIADVDGNGRPEVVVAAADSVSVYQVGIDPDHTISVHWSADADDSSSNITGTSVFDFDGDGQTEVIHGDECHVRVLDGPGNTNGTTSTRFQIPNSSCTATEYPVVADVTGNGRGELVVVSNDASAMNTGCSPHVSLCQSKYPGYVATRGVRVFRDREDRWSATRAIWNQHAYHVTNVCDGQDMVCGNDDNRVGAVPTNPLDPWSFTTSMGRMNGFRVNTHAADPRSAPDLTVATIEGDFSQCPGELRIRASVLNIGALVAGRDVPVAFYQRHGETGQRTLLGVVPLGAVVAPGSTVEVELASANLDLDKHGIADIEVVVDDDGFGGDRSRECREENNGLVRELACVAPAVPSD